VAAQFALQAVMFTPPADETAAVRRRIRAAELLFLGGDVHRSLEQLEALPRGDLSTPDLERTLPLLLDLTGVVHGNPRASAIVAEAVETAGADLRRRALVLALAADLDYGVRGGRRRAAERAIACADVAGPEAIPALHRALINLVISKVTGAEGLDVELIDRARSLESGLPNLRLHDSADFHLGVWSGYIEDLATSRSALRFSIERARKSGDDVAVATSFSNLAATELLAGNYEAASIALEGADEAAMWHDWPPFAWLLEPRCDLMIAAGDLEGAAELAARHLVDDERSTVETRFVGGIVRGRLSFWSGDVAGAVPHFELAAWCAGEWDAIEPGARHRLDPDLAEGYIALGRLTEAEAIADRLGEFGDRLQRPALVGDACRIEALIAASRGELDAAADRAEAAVAAHRISPLRLEEARSLLTLGQIDRRRKARRSSRAALDAALELARAIGHRPLCAAIETELSRVAVARSGNDLTATERRVAELISEGATNREAAAALFVSVRTVETHVASIYRKLGVRTRSELTSRLSR
jgi:DNA-binding CsgD family transcriptional regulator